MTITEIRTADAGAMTTATDGTAGAVCMALTAHPGATVAVIAEAAKVSRSTASKVLAGLEEAGQAVRTAGTGTGRAKTGDTWKVAPARENTPHDDSAEAGEPPASNAEPEEAAGTGFAVDLHAAIEILEGEAERRARAEADLAKVAAEEAQRRAEIDARLRQARTQEETRRALADLLATVTTTYAAVIAGDEAATAAGLEQITVQAGMARRAAKAPTPSTRAALGMTGTGARSAPRPLRPLVEAHLAAHPGKEFTATEIARVLDRSSGAVANVLEKLTGSAVELTCERPRRFRATGSAEPATATANATPGTRAADRHDSAPTGPTAHGKGADAPAGRAAR